MKIPKFIVSKNIFLIIYKILHDAIFLILLTFAALLFTDALLPGLVTSKVSFSKVVIALIIITISITYLGKKLEISYKEIKINKSKFLPILILFSFLLIGNSMLKFTFWQNIIITLTTLFIFFLFYELIFHHQE